MGMLTANLFKMAQDIDAVERVGPPEDVPEGVRYIQVSDTSALTISDALRAAAVYIEEIEKCPTS